MKRRLYPGTGLLPAVAVVLGGLLLHAVDQMPSFRAGPVPILVTAPIVATLVYLSVRRTPARRAFGLLTWGVVGSGLGVLGYYLVGVSYQLPRALTDWGLIVADHGMFLRFVHALAAVYGVAARLPRWTAVAALLSAPVVQATFAVALIVLVELGRFA